MSDFDLSELVPEVGRKPKRRTNIRTTAGYILVEEDPEYVRWTLLNLGNERIVNFTQVDTHRPMRDGYWRKVSIIVSHIVSIEEA